MTRAVHRSALLGLLALLLTALGLVAAPAQAAGCTCARGDVAASADRADVVLSGTVTQVAREDPASGERPRTPARLTYTVEVDRAYQGPVTREVVQVSSSADRAACGLGYLPVGERFVFFATARGSALSSDQCAGTAAATAPLETELREVLGAGRAVGAEPVEPDPPTATVVDDSPPPELGRTAAPGAALALIGLLGLLVVRRRAR